MRKKFLALAAALFLNFAPVSAEKAWTLPEHGLYLESGSKQSYLAEKIDKYFNTKPDAIKFEAPDGWNFETFDVDGVAVECLENPGAGTSRVVFQLHGGGYILPLSDVYRNFAVKQAVLADAAKIYMIDYRLAPDNIYPAALEDAVKAYKEILRRGANPREIIFIGDSAGGNLAVELSIYLRENNLPQPKVLILVSPWTTLETKMPSRKYNETRDLVLGKGSPLFDGVRKPAYAKGLKLKDPRLSPIYADLKKLPPMLIQAGGYELFLDESLALAKKAAADDVKVTLTVYPEMPHDFALILPTLQDSVESFREIRDFVNAHMN